MEGASAREVPPSPDEKKAKAYLSRILTDFLSGPPLFTYVEIETASACNRRCAYCPNSTVGRPERFMDEWVFHNVIDQLSQIGYAGRLSPHFYGEPLLDDRLSDLLSYARGRLPHATIKLFTNGDFLSYPLFLRLLEAGVDVFRIAQHGAKPTQTLADTLSRIGPDVHRRRIEYLNYYDQAFPLFNRGGTVEPVKELRLSQCDYVTGLTVDCDGNVVLCCNDYSSEHVFGSVKREKLLDIWLKPEYRDARYRIESGIWPLDICRTCVGESPTERAMISPSEKQLKLLPTPPSTHPAGPSTAMRGPS